MHRFRNILVPIDDTSNQPVLARATRLAKWKGAAIKLIAVVEDLPWYSRLLSPNSEDLRALLVRERSEALDGLAAQLREDGLDVTTEVLRGRRHHEIVREVLRGGHDLLLKKAEPNEGLLFGSTDMHLLRSCPCPLLLLKPEHDGGDFARILAAVDPAPPPNEADPLHLKAELTAKDAALDAKILELAGSLADEEGGDLHIVHVWSAPGEELLRGDPMLAQDQVDRYVSDSQAEARKALDHLLAKVPDQSGHRIVHLIKGVPEDAVVEAAKTNRIDLIVMGTVARTGISGLLIGNTAESILQRVDCSVLAIKPDAFVSPVSLND
ncbi:universal stress protein [Isosphaeraceae bacterium EP7]